MCLYVENIFLFVKCIFIVGNLLYLITYCGKNSVESDKYRKNNYIDKNNYNNRDICEKEKLPVRIIKKEKSYRDISSKASLKKKNYTISDSNSIEFKGYSSSESKKNGSDEYAAKFEKQYKKTASSIKIGKKKIHSTTKSKKSTLKSSITSLPLPEVMVPVEEKIRFPNISSKVLKHMENLKVPNTVSYFKTKHITKEPRLVHALDRIEIYLNRIRSY